MDIGTSPRTSDPDPNPPGKDTGDDPTPPAINLVESIGMSNDQGSWALEFDDEAPAMSMRIIVGQANPVVFPMTKNEVDALMKWLGLHSSQLKKATSHILQEPYQSPIMGPHREEN